MEKKRMSITVKLSWTERFINFMTHHTNLYERKTKANKNLDGLARDKRLADQLRPFFNELREEAYLEGYKDATKGDDPQYEIPY